MSNTMQGNEMCIFTDASKNCCVTQTIQPRSSMQHINDVTRSKSQYTITLNSSYVPISVQHVSLIIHPLVHCEIPSVLITNLHIKFS